ncbi:MAG: hypothetical protein WD926_00860 [Patescibacteria group bacterium]
MAKKSHSAKAKIVERFLESPEDPETREVLSLIPLEDINQALERRYGYTVPYMTSHRGIAASVAVCQMFEESGMDPREYSYGGWFKAPQGVLDGKTPELLCRVGRTEEVIEFAEHTVQQVKKLGGVSS